MSHSVVSLPVSETNPCFETISCEVIRSMPGRTRGSHKVSYREPTSEIDTEDEEARFGHTKPVQRPSRKRRRVSYHEESSGSDHGVECERGVSSGPATQGSRRRATKGPTSKQDDRASICRQPTSTKKTTTSLGTKHSKKLQSDTVNARTMEEAFDVCHLGGKVPPWQTLPYEILLEIFQYAAYPLATGLFIPNNSSIKWLLRSALLCKGFAEPALSALYYSPPLYPPSRAHKLLASLADQLDTSFLNYRAKVKYLDFEAVRVLTFKHEGRPPLQLAELVAMTPQICGIRMHLSSDLPSSKSYALCHPRRNTCYQSSLFPALNDNNIRLSEWLWNANLGAGSHSGDDNRKEIHRMRAFQTLERLFFLNSNHKDDIERFASAASILPNLKDLTLKNVEIEEHQHLELLPSNLESLAIINCQSVKSSVLAPFLRSHGGNLRRVVLNHNNSLDLAFLPHLATSCPKLEFLQMDLRYHSSYIAFRDSEPTFKLLLSHDMIPSWPRTLQRLELFHLRKWDTTAASNFFSSLVDSAADLPNLRHIDIKASIGESNWRDRISFRNRWTSRMEKVFKRVPAPPDPRLNSITMFMKHKKDFRNPSITGTKLGPVTVKMDKGEIFSHIGVQPLDGTTNPPSDSDTPLASRLRSTQLNHPPSVPHIPRPSRKRRKRKRATEADSSTEEDSALEDLNIDEPSRPPADDEDDKDMYIQGMCDVVRVAIDNLRPTEEQLGESDFLDEEISGDEDWVEDDDVRGGGGGGDGYAW
ncbi:MAG: hypothetical protein Q9186_004840 [Xanthomendoza sp. 1 TL-2023]